MRHLALAIILFASALISSASFADYLKGVEAYSNGDYATALEETWSSALQGNAKAQYFLGFMLEKGKGIGHDHEQAFYWYKLAAQQGYVDAQFYLAGAYYLGDYFTQDYKEAAYWYKLAAEQGYADAQAQLAMMYFVGEGVIQNYVFAHMWYNLATMNASIHAIYRDEVAKNMTPGQIAEAQSLAKQCVEQNYKDCS